MLLKTYLFSRIVNYDPILLYHGKDISSEENSLDMVIWLGEWREGERKGWTDKHIYYYLP